MEPELSSLPAAPSEAPALVSEQEATRRALACVREAAHLLRLPAGRVWAAMGLFHRFFLDAPMGMFPPCLFACTCLFVAAKVSDSSPVPLRDVVNAYYASMYPAEPPLQRGPVMQKLKEAIIVQEQYLVRKLRFELTVHSPYGFLLNYAKTFSFPAATVKVAWAILNDSLSSSVCVVHMAHVLAAAALVVAEQLRGTTHPLPVTPGMSQLQRKWYNVCDVTDQQLADCTHALLSLYEHVRESNE